MEWHIGSHAIRMCCIQTLPGSELSVANKLSEACQSLNIPNFAILKGFGSFDIILLYTAPDFEPLLTKAGLIKDILKSNLFFCFQYLSNDSRDFFDSLSRHTYTGLSLLKIDPQLQNIIPNIEVDFLSNLNKGEYHHFLGTLGWNEIIFLLNSEDISQLVADIYKATTSTININGDLCNKFIKTFSFIGINYKDLPTISQIKKGYRYIKQFLNDKPSMKEHLSGDINVSISLSLEPKYTSNIKKYWLGKDFNIYDALGKDDIVIRPNVNVTWGHILSSILDFRYKFRNQVYATKTSIHRKYNEKPTRQVYYIRRHKPSIKFDYNVLSDIFGKPYAPRMASHFYALNSMLADPITGGSFYDMLKYHRYVFSAGELIKESGGDNRDFGLSAAEALKVGAELRSYGTYGTVEEASGRFSRLRGGVQRALLAMEFIPAYVLNKIDPHRSSKWEGFIISHEQKYSHINEIINVPSETFWKPTSWWALYHEIAHILIDNTRWVTMDVPQIKNFFIQKEYREFWYKFLNELAAEVVGFELGFFGNYDLFLKLLWQFLKKIKPFQEKVSPMELYLVRSFYVYLFYEHFVHNNIKKKEIYDDDFIYSRWMQHVSHVEKITGDPFDRKHFFIAKNTDLFKELYSFSEYLFKKMKKLNLQPNIDELNGHNSIAIWKTIKEGKIWWGEIECPEAILYKIFEGPMLTFSQEIAIILTFWNQHMRKLGDPSNASFYSGYRSLSSFRYINPKGGRRVN